VKRPEPTLKQRAVRLLARREHSRLELKRKLAPHTHDEAELDQVLEQLAARGLLSDARLAEQVAHSRKDKAGLIKIAHELRAKGVSDEIAARVLAPLNDDQLATAKVVWEKKFGIYPRDAAERAKQMRFLQGRGFSLDVIRRVLREED
jgi:regulatory protein